jgi:hypothetical protein
MQRKRQVRVVSTLPRTERRGASTRAELLVELAQLIVLAARRLQTVKDGIVAPLPLQQVVERLAVAARVIVTVRRRAFRRPRSLREVQRRHNAGAGHAAAAGRTQA